MGHADDIRAAIQQHAPAGGTTMPGGYSGSSRIHYGLSAAWMHGCVSDFLKNTRGTLTFDAWVQTLDGLYQGESFEERVIAGLMLAKSPKFKPHLLLTHVYIWLGELEGWAEIDATCQSGFTAKEMLADWPSWDGFLHTLSIDQHISRRRASLVLLTKPLRELADKALLVRALENVERLKDEKHKLITKAVSWVLRAGIKYHADAVRDYMDANADTLPKIALREARTKLTTGKKTGQPAKDK